jgi:hypothetical protein
MEYFFAKRQAIRNFRIMPFVTTSAGVRQFGLGHRFDRNCHRLDSLAGHQESALSNDRYRLNRLLAEPRVGVSIAVLELRWFRAELDKLLLCSPEHPNVALEE